jgi:hypothetical protein
LELSNEVNLGITGLCESRFQHRHRLCLLAAVRTSEPLLVQPGEDYGEDGGGNPTDCLLLLSPIKVRGEAISVAELFQRTEARPATQRGYVRFLVHMCELAAQSVVLRQTEWNPRVQETKGGPWWKFWKWL